MGLMARLVGKNFTITPKITTFTANGTFAADPMSSECHLLVIAGGGGSSHGGGGGGGFRELPAHPIPTSPVPVTVGAGGAGAPDSNNRGSSGSDSVFGSATPITSSGGGGAGGLAVGGDSEALNGGSGGGSGGNHPAHPGGGTGNSGSFDPPEGNDGGHGRYNGSSYYSGGGGGGAGGTGGNETPDGLGNDWNAIGGQGGLAKMSTVSGSKTWYSGGGGAGYRFTHELASTEGKINKGYLGGHTTGGGSIFPAQKGGAGDSNHQGAPSPTLGTGVANTGGGGGGVCADQATPEHPADNDGTGAAGGSGIVIVSEPNVNASGVWDYKQVFHKKVIGEWR